VDVVSGSNITVAVADGDETCTCPANFNGNDSNNIVNRLGTIGVQIEQSEEARKCYGIQIADAVANVISPRIKV
jgi:phage replication-related protein YjqB (UPF0714/DUF867 family)